MTDYDIEVQNLIGNLDQAVISFEARWGADRLPQIASEGLRAKIDRQFERLHQAVVKNDLVALRELVPGTIRAYEAMEKDALENGHVPYDPVFWEIQMPNGRIVRLVKNNGDATMAAKSGTEVWTLEEVAIIMDSKSLSAIHAVKALWPESTLAGITTGAAAFDFSKGDDIGL